MSQSPAPELDDTTRAPLPAFLPPSQLSHRPRRFDPPPAPSSTSPQLAEVDELPSQLDEVDDGSAWDEGTPETLTASSFPASTEAPKALPRLDAASRKVYAAGIARGAQVASAVVDTRLGAQGAFLMHDNEAADIAAPASRILARRAPLPVPGGAAGATEAADVVELVSAVIGYVMAAFGRRRSAVLDGEALPQLPSREERAHALAPAPVDELPPAPRPPMPYGAEFVPVIGAGA